jgi:hypothetical protein
LRTLASLLFETDDLLRWRAIEAIGIVAKQIVQRDDEAVRRSVRRLLWLMNDESGGVCWCAPEAVGEILRNCPGLLDEFGRVMASFLVEEPFEAGTRWAIGRVGQLNPSEFAHTHRLLLTSLDSDIPEIRAYSVLALQALDVAIPEERREQIAADDTEVPFYDFTSGQLQQRKVAELLR